MGYLGERSSKRGNTKLEGPEAAVCTWHVQGVARRPWYAEEICMQDSARNIGSAQ